MREPITIEDVLNSRLIADPLHLLDCSLVSDGGAALVMTSAERAPDFPKKPVYLLGVGEGHSHEHVSQALSLTTSAAKEAGERAYAMAGVGPKDIDVAELYDCFTPVVIIGPRGHPGSMFHLTEAVKQLRGECGPRQVKDAKIALVHGQGGIMSTHCSAILGTERI